MDDIGAADDIVGQLYEASLRPDRLFELIAAWDAQVSSADPDRAFRIGGFSDPTVMRHVERALAILDEVGGAETRRLDDLLSGMPTAAMVVSETGVVSAANLRAQKAFGLFPGGSVRLLAGPRAEVDDLFDRITRVALAPRGHDAAARIDLGTDGRAIFFHLRALGGSPTRRQALVVSTELVWDERAGGVLARVFGLTAAEIALLRRLVLGETVREAAHATGRSEGTVRSHLHATLGKVGVRSQGELVRIAGALLQAVAFDAAAADATCRADAIDAGERVLRLADGRRFAVMSFGNPTGRPVLWLMPKIGLFRPSAAAAREMRRRGLRIVVPIRAGYGASDPLPKGRDLAGATLADVCEVLDLAGIESCPVVAPIAEIRTALELAQRAPGRVERIVGVGASFPCVAFQDFRRRAAVGRVYAAVVRFAPHLLPFLVRASHARILRVGMEDYLRSVYHDSEADVRALRDRDVAEAVVAAFTYLYASGQGAQAAFCADAIRSEAPWPPGLASVGCPVTLVHGEQDGFAPAETAREAAATHGWRYRGLPDGGQLVSHSHWREVLGAVDGDAEGEASRPDAAE